MTIRALFVLTGSVGILRIGLVQADIIPDGFWEVAKDFPVLAIFLGTLYYLSRLGERMLEAQRIALKEVYEAHQTFVSSLLDQLERKQDKMDESVGSLTNEIAILRGTLSEVAKVDDVIDRLLAEIRK
jgi:NAD kinase